MKTCAIKGCKRPHQARGLCQVHYAADLSWSGVKCKSKSCEKYAYKRGGFCDSHRKIEKVKSLRKKGLCCIEGCGKNATIKKFFQDQKEMYSTTLKFCFEHLRGNNESAAKSDKKRALRDCVICHSNPARLCELCKGEKR